MPRSWPALPPTIRGCFRPSSIAARSASLDLNLIHARATLVRARTMIVNALRGLVKSAGGRLPACSTESLPARAHGRDSARAGRWPRPR